jgi:ribosomal protein S18 acetylase RimI-like enzyme
VKTLQTIIRELRRSDLPALEVILEETGLFPSDLLLPMAEPWLAGGSDHRWLVALDQDSALGFAYAEPERMTDGTFNLLAIAVQPDAQGKGLGKALVSSMMQRLRHDGGRLLLVETSSLDEFASTRAFYESQSFTLEARIRDFYREGEDKIVYWARL